MKYKIAAVLLALHLNVHPGNTHNSEQHCLAKNMYYEARGESEQGKLAVAYVTLNRAKDKSICTVVYEPQQFSWTASKPNKKIPQEYLDLAQQALSEQITFPATHFHNKTRTPGWAKKKQLVATIGNHRFYK